jgi:CRP/FNR family transcriptional regulator
LNNEELEKLISISFYKSYKSNYLLHYEKLKQNRLLFLVNGLAKAYKIDKYENEIFLYYIYSGDIISEISTLQHNHLISYSNIELLEESQILSIDYKEFKKEFLDNGILCMEFANEILKQSKQLRDLVNREFVFDSVSKVAMILDKNLDMFNYLKRYDISLMLHIQPSTLSRVLNRLKRNNIIDIIRGKVIITNQKALHRIYNE